ncbi:MAG: Coenzyme F420 hydrogenase/dehydrogenase, beta subunit C-terminal domain [Nitrososphaerales archaeon]
MEAKRRFNTFGTLLTEVIRPGLCISCGACVASCEAKILSFVDETPTMKGKCTLCEYCYYQCPKTKETEEFLVELEKKAFGNVRTKEEEDIGINIVLYSARSLKENIRKEGQDGAVVTTLLAYMLDKKLVDGAVVAGLSKEEPWKPLPKIAFTEDELIASAGTKYTSSPNLMALSSDILKDGNRKVAFVGTPCQVLALRKSQFHWHGFKAMGNLVSLVIGLFCMKCFSYNKLIKEYLQRQKELELERVTKFDIKKGKFLAYIGEEIVLSIPIAEIYPLAKQGCYVCKDLTSELADISVGSIGSPQGWSTVIIRNEKGKDIFDSAVRDGYIECKKLSEVIPGLEALIKLSHKKKEKALK